MVDVKFDGTITAGNILTVIGFVVAAVGAYTRLKDEISTKLTELSVKVSKVEGQMEVLYGIVMGNEERHRNESKRRG